MARVTARAVVAGRRGRQPVGRRGPRTRRRCGVAESAGADPSPRASAETRCTASARVLRIPSPSHHPGPARHPGGDQNLPASQSKARACGRSRRPGCVHPRRTSPPRARPGARRPARAPRRRTGRWCRTSTQRQRANASRVPVPDGLTALRPARVEPAAGATYRAGVTFPPLRTPTTAGRAARDRLRSAQRQGRDPRQPGRRPARRPRPFPGIVGFDDTVRPDLERALLAGHDLVLLGRARPGQDPADAHAGRACSTSGSPTSPAPRPSTTRWHRSACTGGGWPPSSATTCRSRGGTATTATARSSPRRTPAWAT